MEDESIHNAILNHGAIDTLATSDRHILPLGGNFVRRMPYAGDVVILFVSIVLCFVAVIAGVSVVVVAATPGIFLLLSMRPSAAAWLSLSFFCFHASHFS